MRLIGYNAGMDKKRIIKRGIGLFPALMLLIVISGCSSTTYWEWEHQERKDRLQRLQDEQDCRRLARREAAWYGYDDFFYPDYPFFRPYHPHPWAYPQYWGWNSHYRFLHRQEELRRLFRLCMEAKGWHLVKKTRTDQETTAPE